MWQIADVEVRRPENDSDVDGGKIPSHNQRQVEVRDGPISCTQRFSNLEELAAKPVCGKDSGLGRDHRRRESNPPI